MRKGETDLKFEFFFVDQISDIFPFDLSEREVDENKVLRMELIEKEVNNNILHYSSFEETRQGNNEAAQK